MKLFPGVHLLEGSVGGRPLRLPLLVGQWKSVLIDTGTATDVESLILPSLLKLKVKPSSIGWIINTHCDFDHQGGNRGMKQAAGHAILACGDADRAQIESPKVIYRQRYDRYRADGISYPGAIKKWVLSALGNPQPVDVTFRGGERLRIGPDWELEILHLPGHSHGHLGVLDRKHRALYGGDAIHGSVYLDTGGKPALCPTYLYPEAYRQTIRLVEGLDIDLYSGCHWPVKRGPEIAEFCRESDDFVTRAETLILSELRQPRTLKQLCQKIGPQLGDWPEAVHTELSYAFSGHLRDLKNQGRIKTIAGKPVRYAQANMRIQ